MSKGTAAAKRRANYERLKTTFPERIDFYNEQIEEMTATLRQLGACLRCGRELKSDDARDLGYGKDCLAKMMEETTNT